MFRLCLSTYVLHQEFIGYVLDDCKLYILYECSPYYLLCLIII